MKLLLDMYKGLGKEQRDKAQLMAAERKTRAELEELRQQIKKYRYNWKLVMKVINNMRESWIISTPFLTYIWDIFVLLIYLFNVKYTVLIL